MTGHRSAIERQREEDAAFFEDWSAGRDEGGLWLWADAIQRVIVMRPTCTDDVDIINKLGGKRQAWHRYDSSYHRDWYVPPINWRAVKAAIPRLLRIRAARRAQLAAINHVRTGR